MNKFKTIPKLLQFNATPLIEICYYIGWIFTFLVILIESITYPSAILKYISLNQLAALWIIIIFTLVPFFIGKKLLIDTLSLKLLLTITLISFFIHHLFYITEIANYTNFVLANFHFHFSGLFNLSLLFLLLFILRTRDLFFRFTNKVGYSFSLITILILLFSVVNYSQLFSLNLYRSVLFMLNSPHATYSERISYDVGKDFYSLMELVLNKTSPDAKILIPPQDAPWYNFGNRGYVRYFLYPRELINGSITKSPDDFTNIQYIFVIPKLEKNNVPKGENCWPQFNVPAKSFIYLDQGKIVEINIDNWDNHCSEHFGVLKL